MNWDRAIETIRPHVVKIETPSGYGTGFLSIYNQSGSLCGFATAAHVVDHADEWDEPIRISHAASGATRFLKSGDRVFYVNRRTDSAIVLFLKGDLVLPERPIDLLPVDGSCGIGSDVGWLGYPSLEPDTLCFFAGTVSAHQPDRQAYLIDGVAINGVSGGPVFHCTSSSEVQIIGSVTSYHPNRAAGQTLPGLLRAQDVSYFRDVAQHIRDIDEANAKKRAIEAQQEETQNPELSVSDAPSAGTAISSA